MSDEINTSSVPRTKQEKDNANRSRNIEREAKQESVSTLGVLGAALREKRMLDGVISGVVTDKKCAYWVMLYEQNIIKIPFTESYMTLPSDLIPGNAPTIIRRQNQLLTKSIGMNTPFILTSFEIDADGNYVWIASRTQALARMRKRYFGENAPRPVKVGMDVVGQVISHDEFTAYVCICGIDIQVHNYDLSHRYISDVSREFAVGSSIKLRITEIKEVPGDIPVMKVSGKEIEVEQWTPRLKLLRSLGAKPRLRGIVTTVREDKASASSAPGMRVNLWLEGLNIGAFSNTTRLKLDDKLITTGTVVQFEVNGISKNNYAYGEILFVVKAASPV